MSTAEEIQWDSYGPTTGPTPGGRDIPGSAKEAAARGLDGTGIPLGPGRVDGSGPALGAIPPAPGHTPRSGGKSLLQQVQGVEDSNVHDQYGLHQFTEDARALCARLAVIIEMTSGELKEDAKLLARQSGDGHLSWKDKITLAKALRKISRRLHSMADHFADAGGDAAGAWRVMQECMDELEASTEKPKSSRKGFQLHLGK